MTDLHPTSTHTAVPVTAADVIADAVAWVTDPSPTAPAWAVGLAAGFLHTVVDRPVVDLLVDAAFPDGPSELEAREVADLLAALEVPGGRRLTDVAAVVHAPIKVWKPSPLRAGMYAAERRVLSPHLLRTGRNSLTDLLAADGKPMRRRPLKARLGGPDPDGGTRWTLTVGPHRQRQIAVWHERSEQLGIPWTNVHTIPSIGRDYGPPIIDGPFISDRTALRAALLIIDGRMDPGDFHQRADVLPGWN